MLCVLHVIKIKMCVLLHLMGIEVIQTSFNCQHIIADGG